MTRVPSFKRRSRRVANSAVASACALGIASRTVRISQYGGMQDQAHLVGELAAAAGTIRGELGLVQLDQVLGLAAGAINRLVNKGGSDLLPLNGWKRERQHIIVGHGGRGAL
jgi:hypothetical protein